MITWVTVEEVNTGFLFQSPLGPRDLAAVAAGAAAGRDGKRSSYVAGVLEDEVEAEGDGSIIWRQSYSTFFILNRLPQNKQSRARLAGKIFDSFKLSR